MIIEGVNFVKGVCEKMSKEEFIEHHKDVFWQDRDESVRERMLADAYEVMTNPPVPTGRKKKSASKTEDK